MRQDYETEYSIIKQTTRFGLYELELVKILLSRADKKGKVNKFNDLDYKILEDLDSVGVIYLRKDLIIIEPNIALPLVQ